VRATVPAGATRLDVESARQSRQPSKSLFPPELWIVVQDHVQQRVVDLQNPVVLDEPELAEFVHEPAHARPRGADDLRERLLTDLPNDGLGSAFLAEISHQEEHPRQPANAAAGRFGAGDKYRLRKSRLADGPHLVVGGPAPPAA
jgi:hypothetical protein